MNLDNQKMVGYGIIVAEFETYWENSGTLYWNSKTNGWIAWLYDKWNSGLINLEEYRYLINVDME